MTIHDGVEIGMVAVILVGFAAVHADRKRLNRGLVGRRVTQFLVVLLALPITVILSLEGKLGGDAVGAIIGAILGYVLSPLAKETDD